MPKILPRHYLIDGVICCCQILDLVSMTSKNKFCQPNKRSQFGSSTLPNIDVGKSQTLHSQCQVAWKVEETELRIEENLIDLRSND